MTTCVWMLSRTLVSQKVALNESQFGEIFHQLQESTVVELTGEISYDGYPADALIQFDLSGGSFEAVYLGINDVDQSRLLLSALLTKMCDATY